MEREFHDLWSRLEQIVHLARVRAPAFAERIWNAIVHEDDNRPDPAKLRAARQAFLDLPEHEQRRILGGWRPAEDRPDPRRVAHDLIERSSMVRAMVIEPDAENGWEPEVWHDYVFSDSFSPVQIIVQEGASEDDVLNALEVTKAVLEESYAKLIDEAPALQHYPPAPGEDVNPVPQREKKSGRSEGQTVLSPASKANGKALVR